MLNKEQAIKELKQNKVICVPTDTVFGLVALATLQNSFAIAKIKGNKRDKQYTIMVSNKTEALNLWEKNPIVEQLVHKHFPGDLTIIAKQKNKHLFLGIRIPDNPILIDIIKEVGPIYATSTNKVGEKPLDDLKKINKIFPEIKILQGECGNQKPSTIIKVEDLNITMIRQGNKIL